MRQTFQYTTFDEARAKAEEIRDKHNITTFVYRCSDHFWIVTTSLMQPYHYVYSKVTDLDKERMKFFDNPGERTTGHIKEKPK